MSEGVALWLQVPEISLSLMSGAGEIAPEAVGGEGAAILLSRASFAVDVGTLAMNPTPSHAAAFVTSEGLSKAAAYAPSLPVKISLIIMSQAVGIYDSVRDFIH